MVCEGHSPGVFQRAGHAALDGVVAVVPHLGYGLAGGRVVVAVGHDREFLDAGLDGFAFGDQGV